MKNHRVQRKFLYSFDLPLQFGTLTMSEEGDENGIQKIPSRIYG